MFDPIRCVLRTASIFGISCTVGAGGGLGVSLGLGSIFIGAGLDFDSGVLMGLGGIGVSAGTNFGLSGGGEVVSVWSVSD